MLHPSVEFLRCVPDGAFHPTGRDGWKWGRCQKRKWRRAVRDDCCHWGTSMRGVHAHTGTSGGLTPPAPAQPAAVHLPLSR